MILYFEHDVYITEKRDGRKLKIQTETGIVSHAFSTGFKDKQLFRCVVFLVVALEMLSYLLRVGRRMEQF